MVLLLAPGCQLTVHFGRVRIVNFLQKITEMPGCERSLSRCRSTGTALPGRLGCQPKPSLPAVGVGLEYGNGCAAQAPEEPLVGFGHRMSEEPDRYAARRAECGNSLWAGPRGRCTGALGELPQPPVGQRRNPPGGGLGVARWRLHKD
jgi:hypothetical protein